MKQDKKYLFFLGRHDAQMDRIREILRDKGFDDQALYYRDCRIMEDRYAQTARYSNSKQGDQIAQAVQNGFIPVIVELEINSGLPEKTINIGLKDKIPALTKVLKLLGKEPTRTDDLIIANDRGGIQAMVDMGATDSEIEEVRKRDRRSLGISQEHEEQALNAIENSFYSRTGLQLVQLPHAHIQTVTDRLWRRGKAFNLLIEVTETNTTTKLAKHSVHYFGPRETCLGLMGHFAKYDPTPQFIETESQPRFVIKADVHYDVQKFLTENAMSLPVSSLRQQTRKPSTLEAVHR